jgi:hypothetical protein
MAIGDGSFSVAKGSRRIILSGKLVVNHRVGLQPLIEHFLELIAELSLKLVDVVVFRWKVAKLLQPALEPPEGDEVVLPSGSRSD